MNQHECKEIGSFIELQLPSGNELYKGDKNILRLNSGRAAIWHAFRLTGCKTIWIPYYQCDTVCDFLHKKNVDIKYYHINSSFEPTDINADLNESVLLVNYYGVMSSERMRKLCSRFSHVIIDNSQAFFARPLENCLNVYSARKFIGVPDGAYVIGEKAENYREQYEQGYSSDTAKFLLMRLEYGCDEKTYAERMKNEQRIDSEDIKMMSDLTRKILDGTDYDWIISKRRENFQIACKLFSDINLLQTEEYYDDNCVPMVYPLLVEDDNLLNRLLSQKHFQGHWWSYLCDEMPKESVEYWLSRYVIPITIDQRYGEKDLLHVMKVIEEGTNR